MLVFHSIHIGLALATRGDAGHRKADKHAGALFCHIVCSAARLQVEVFVVVFSDLCLCFHYSMVLGDAPS